MAPSLDPEALGHQAPALPSLEHRSVSAEERVAAMGALRDALALLMGAGRRGRGRVAREALSHTHLRAMFLLLRQGEATAGALARAADLNPASVTAMVDQLQVRGLVVRRRHAADRRICLVTLTQTGHAVVSAQEQRTAARLHGLLEDISDEELRAATRVLDRLTALMDEAADSLTDSDDCSGGAGASKDCGGGAGASKDCAGGAGASKDCGGGAGARDDCAGGVSGGNSARPGSRW